ncbi:MAG: signal peptidase II [Clostridiales bacterium]|nr:signal peptidase II [Clostridiales bacterium]
MSKIKKKLLVFDVFLMCLLIITDQITKYFAVLKLKHQPAYSVIDGILEFNYLENRGAAFGLLQDQKGLFLFVGIIFLCAIAYVLYKTPDGKKFTFLHILLVAIAGGAVGNMLDRIRLDYVVDFIYFVYINFPIFNVADMYVTIASVILFVLFLFYYKEEDLNFLNFKQNKYRELK